MDTVLFPNAKLNYGLTVGSRRPDGFHRLHTIFLPLYGYYDELRIHELPGPPAIALHAHQSYNLGPQADNLVAKAYRLLLSFEPPRVEATLVKHIPIGAGLGGGSADAAFMLQHMALRCSKRVPHDLLPELALTLGSDVPFFLINRPCQASGRGELCQPIQLDLPFQWVLVATPNQRISTAQAFATLDHLRILPPEDTTQELVQDAQYPLNPKNDFWPAVLRLCPSILQLYQALKALSPAQLSLSGSGSTLYALFQGPRPAHDLEIPNATTRLLPLGQASSTQE